MFTKLPPNLLLINFDTFKFIDSFFLVKCALVNFKPNLKATETWIGGGTYSVSNIPVHNSDILTMRITLSVGFITDTWWPFLTTVKKLNLTIFELTFDEGAGSHQGIIGFNLSNPGNRKVKIELVQFCE
jgi:hypothetical protein